MRNFQTFSRDLPRCTTSPQVTVLRSGILSLNRAALATLGDPGAVELLYDPDHRVVGLRAIDQRSDTAHIVRQASCGANGPFLVTAIAFTKFYDIDTGRSLRRDAFLDDGILCVSLDGPAVAVTSNRAHRHTEMTTVSRANPQDGLPVAGSA